MKLKYADQAVNDLQHFNAADRTLVAKKIHYLADNFELLKQSKKIRELQRYQVNTATPSPAE